MKVQWSGFTQKTHLTLEQSTESGWQTVAEKKHLPARGHRTYTMSASVAGSYSLRLAAVAKKRVESASKFDVVAENPEGPASEPPTEQPGTISIPPISGAITPPGSANGSSLTRLLDSDALHRQNPIATASAGTYAPPEVSCGGEIDNENALPFANFNRMEILPAVASATDGMWWAYQSLLYQWTTSGWQYILPGPVQEGYVAPLDNNVVTIGPQAGAGFTGGRLPITEFTVSVAGGYAVYTHLWWYENGWRGGVWQLPEFYQQFSQGWGGWEKYPYCYLYANSAGK